MGFLITWSIIIALMIIVAMIMRAEFTKEHNREYGHRSGRRHSEDDTPVSPLPKSTWLKWPLVGGTFCLMASYLFFAIYIIDPGHIGVPVWFGNVQETAYTEGIKIINPMATIEVMDGRRFAFEFTEENALVSVSKKQNPLTVEVAFPLSLNSVVAWKLYQKIGNDTRYRAQFVSPARAAVRSAIAEYEWGEVTKNLDKIANTMRVYFERNVTRDLMRLGFTEQEAMSAFTFLEVQLRKIVPDAKILAATAEKMAAEQDLERQKTLTSIAGEVALRRAKEGLGVSKLFEALPKGFKPMEIKLVLDALANKVRADAMLKAVETEQVDTIIMGSATPAVSAE